MKDLKTIESIIRYGASRSFSPKKDFVPSINLKPQSPFSWRRCPVYEGVPNCHNEIMWRGTKVYDGENRVFCDMACKKIQKVLVEKKGALLVGQRGLGFTFSKRQGQAPKKQRKPSKQLKPIQTNLFHLAKTRRTSDKTVVKGKS